MDLEIRESEKNIENVEVVVEKDGVEVTKTVKASFKTAAQLPRHTRSDKVFDSLYDDNRPICLAQCGSGWVDTTDEKKAAWFTTDDGPRICVMGLHESYQTAAKKAHRSKKLVEKQGYRSYGMFSYPARNWIVLRRYHPINVVDDEVLATNILNYEKRYETLADIDFGKEIRQKDRHLVKPPEKPATLVDMHPKALKVTKARTRTMYDTHKAAMARLKKDKRLSHKQYIKARNKLKKMHHKALKSMVGHIPSKARDPKQRFAAVVWAVSPKYAHVDRTKYFGYPAPKGEEGTKSTDPAPDKVFTKEDFDEAMLWCVLRTFENEEECKEFIDNKAKHDMAPLQVVCIPTYENMPMDTVLTKEFEDMVEKGYTTDLQQKVIVERQKRTKAGLQNAKDNPDFVQEIVRNEDGTVTATESKATQHIRQALMEEKVRIEEEESQKRAIREAEEQDIQGIGGGGASKEDAVEDAVEEDDVEEDDVETEAETVEEVESQ